MAVQEGLGRLPRIGLTNQTSEWGRIRQKKATFSRLPPTSTTASPKSTWAWPGG